MSDYEFIYVSLSKTDYVKKNITIDEDLCKDDEDDAIESFIKGLAGESKSDKEEYDNGEKISIYLYALDKDRVPHLYKSVKIEKDGDDFKISDEEEFDVGDEFIAYGEEDYSGEKEEKDSKDDDSGDKNKEAEDDKEDDIREVEEACLLSDKFIDLYEAGVISDDTYINLSILLEEVVGRKTIAQLKETKKKETKDRREYLKAHSKAMGGGSYALNDKQKELLNSRDWKNAWDKENEAKQKLTDAEDKYTDMRAEARKRLMAAKKEKREKQVAAMKNNVKDKFHGSGHGKPVTVESMMFEMNREIFYEEDYPLYVLTEAAIIAANTLIYEGFENNINDSFAFSESYSDQKLNEFEDSGLVTSESEKISLLMIDRYMTEKTLKARDRNVLDEKEFGIPETRSYPIHDKVHVRAAIMMFNKVDKKYEKTLANNIIKAMKKFDMLDKVKVGKNNRFKEYLDNASKAFKESYDINPFPPVNVSEFAVGSMLPNKSGWGEPVEEIPTDNTNQDINKYATLYDEVTLESSNDYKFEAYNSDHELFMYESLIPQRNITFDKEVEKLMDKLKEFVNNPKNDYLETILKKSLNYKKTVYTIHLKEQKGDNTNKVISKIFSCGFKDVKDEGVKCIYDKETHGILITLIYDTVTDKIRITYENVKERPKMESYLGLYEERTGMIEKFRLKYTKFGQYVDALEHYYTTMDKDFVPFDQFTEETYLTNEERYYSGKGKLYLANPKKSAYIHGTGGKVVYMYDNKKAFEYVVKIDIEKLPGIMNNGTGTTYIEHNNIISDFKFIDNKFKKYELYYKAKSILKYNSYGTAVFEEIKRLCKKYGLLNDKNKVITEASKEEIDDDIKPIVDILNKKGYKTKYSCSGHTKARIKKDGFRNGIMNGKLYTTARIVFDKDYDIGAPKGWKVKTFDDQIGIYPETPHYDYSKGMPDDAWEKWKVEYMSELKVWANNLGDKPGPEESSKNESVIEGIDLSLLI